MRHRIKSIQKPIDSEREILVKSARIATKGLSVNLENFHNIKVITNGVLIERLPNGSERIIRRIERVPLKRSGIKEEVYYA